MKKGSFSIVWDTEALEHFKEILTFLSKRSAHAPSIVKSAVLSHLEAVSINPLICGIDKLNTHQNKTFRAFVVYSYRVTYQIVLDQNQIRVLRIRHTSREPMEY